MRFPELYFLFSEGLVSRDDVKFSSKHTSSSGMVPRISYTPIGSQEPLGTLKLILGPFGRPNRNPRNFMRPNER